jgi:rhodanese-related sulfurtransferase
LGDFFVLLQQRVYFIDEKLLKMSWILFVILVCFIGFGIYWYFFHVPNYYGYVSKEGESLLHYLDAKNLLTLVQNPKDDILILDVREEEYFLMGHIPTAINFTHTKVEEWYTKIPKDKYLILYCDLTIKTQEVINFLENKNYTKMLNWGKYSRWKFDEEVEENISI